VRSEASGIRCDGATVRRYDGTGIRQYDRGQDEFEGIIKVFDMKNSLFDFFPE
jgi:hypothetical protein